jgi:diguanylate cyclase (GGDEF)-like protein/PAS domain S-box-containing protein
MAKFRRDLGLLCSFSALALFIVVGITKLAARGGDRFDAAAIVALLVVAAFSVPIVAFYFRTKDKEKAEREVREQNRRLNAVLANMPEGVSMFDAEGRLALCNGQFLAIYGLTENHAVPGTAFHDVVELMAATNPQNRIMEAPTVGPAQPSTRVHELADGRVLALTQRPVQGGGWVTTHNDITELRRIEAQLAHVARHDALTELPNRVLFREHVNAALGGSREGEPFAVLCLDLHRFKEVNESLGRPVGDELLRAVAARLANRLAETDMLARLGGDEFAVLQIAANQPMDASALAERLCDALKQPFELKGHQVAVEASIGVAVGPADGADADLLLQNADLALGKAKSDGRGVHRFFEPGMDRSMLERRKLETELRLALKNGDFILFYQPLLHARSEQVTGFEALVRWRHSERGVLSPAAFLPLMEETGLIVPLGAWVMRQACADAARWPEHVSVSVNLAASQFETGDLVAVVVGALSAAALAPGRLVLEITETALLKDSEATLRILHMLRELGVRIAMDDFGTGYSSLSYLRSFPFDKIKIDGSFVRDLPDGADARAIVKAVATLGCNLGIEMTAEGVETIEQLSAVRAEGYTEIQGYLYSKPRPASELAELFFPSVGRAAAG